jgi:hypothetical protein
VSVVVGASERGTRIESGYRLLRRHGVDTASGLLGAVAWSGLPMALALSCIAPALIIAARTRPAVAVRAGAYFLAATWPIVPAAGVFFGGEAGGARGVLLGASFWIAVSVLNILPWIVASPSRPLGRTVGILLGLGLPALPPLSIIGLASPLAGLGWWLPGTSAWGVALYLGLVVLFVSPASGSARSGLMAVAVMAVIGSYAVSMMKAPAASGWTAISTRMSVGGRHGESEAIEQLRRAAATSEARVLVLPESLFARWSTSNDTFLRPLWRELAARGQVVLFGVRRPDAATGLVDSLILVRGRESGEYAQHLPVPVSMYRLGEAGSVPLRWRGPYTTIVAGERVGLQICWEQLLVAPMLALSLERPDRLAGVSNLYFARGTPVAAIQQAAIQSWARLYGVPWVHAVNE